MSQRFLLLCFLFILSFCLYAQTDSTENPADSTGHRFGNFVKDSTTNDSITLSYQSKSGLEDKVDYGAADSIILSLKEKKAYLHGKAWIIYQQIKLEADFIIVDFDNKDVYARGITDSSGKYVGRPNFTDQGKLYEADTMKYNFQSKKGLSMGVLTTEKDGYIHGRKVLRDSMENIYVKDARFTTCNLPDPHFYIAADKIKVIPRKQIVTGPANLVIEKIRTPLFVPFGFFPIPEKKASGLIFPAFGESPDRGFFFRGLGYYFPINDYIDLKLTSDFYFRGSWGVAANSSYYKRYKYSGNFGFNYNQNRIGEEESPDFTISNDIRMNWTFTKDPKARPGSSFGASVNFVTSNFLKNNTTEYNDIIKTNSNSSVSYSKSLFKGKLNLSVNSNIYQDLTRKDVALTLPQMTANVSRQMFFSKFTSKSKTAQSFLRNLGISYNGTFKNEAKIKESTLLSVEALDSFKNGISHSVPIATSFKALKWVTISPGFNYEEFWYFSTIRKAYDIEKDSTIVYEDIKGFERGHQYRTSVGLSTILYGMKQFKSGPLRAIRHVVRPNISLAWNPDFSTGEKNGYKPIQVDTLGLMREYSIFESGFMGRPSLREQATLGFGFGNNLEIKVFSKKDTSNRGIKKIKLIENFNINSSYNFIADSMKLSHIILNGNTTILNRIRINYRSTLDPYYHDSLNGREFAVDRYLWDVEKRLVTVAVFDISVAVSLNPNAFKKKENPLVNQQELEMINNNPENYIDFSIPWNLSFNYNYNIRRSFYSDPQKQQTITFIGDINLTPNWKLASSTSYDLVDNKINLTSIEFYRDLHCWEFSLKWYPIIRRQFEFSLRVKSSTLQDLKLNRRRSWWDS